MYWGLPDKDAEGKRWAPQTVTEEVMSEIGSSLEQVHPGAKHSLILNSNQSVPSDDPKLEGHINYIPMGTVSSYPGQNYAAFRGTAPKETPSDVTASLQVVQLATFLAHTSMDDVSKYFLHLCGQMRASVLKYHLRSSRDGKCATQRDYMRRALEGMPAGTIEISGHSWGCEQALLFALEASMMKDPDGKPKFTKIHIIQFAPYFSGDADLVKCLAGAGIQIVSYLFQLDFVYMMVNLPAYLANVYSVKGGHEIKTLIGQGDYTVVSASSNRRNFLLARKV